jgi:acetyl esterase/lipase
MLKLRASIAVVAVALLSITAAARSEPEPQPVLLWPDGAPGALGKDEVDQPSLRLYLPTGTAPTRTGVIVCPGGGYGHLAMDHEGRQIADWLTSQGIAAFVLKYRLAPRYGHPRPLEDAQRALRYVRLRAKELGLDRIGIWGFSAGGHLASTAGTHFDAGNAAAADPIDRMSSRPDFMILAYPVISMTADYTHRGSRKNLLGENPDPSLVENLSNDKQVTPQTPPTFLFHTNADTGVPAENSVAFYLALRKAGVPAELHIYEQGRHGVGLAPADPILSTWAARLGDWLKQKPGDLQIHQDAVKAIDKGNYDKGRILLNPLINTSVQFSPDSEGFIRNWLVLAPIPSGEEYAGAVDVNNQQIKDEGNIRPKAGDKATVGTRELVWRAHQASGFILDFKEFVGAGQSEDVIGYAVSYVIADGEMSGLKLQMGSNDQARIYLNGKPVLKFEETRTLEKDQNVADNVTLNKGVNTIVFKVVNEKNNWQGCLRFTDQSGAPVKGLKVALSPQ